MNLVTFNQKDDRPQIGAVTGDGRNIVILQAGAEAMNCDPSPFFTDMLAFLNGGAEARDHAMEVVEYVTAGRPPGTIAEFDSVRLLATVPRPESIRDCMAFGQRIINIIRAVGLKKLAPFDRWLEKRFGPTKTLAYRANKAWYERPI